MCNFAPSLLLHTVMNVHVNNKQLSSLTYLYFLFFLSQADGLFVVYSPSIGSSDNLRSNLRSLYQCHKKRIHIECRKPSH